MNRGDGKARASSVVRPVQRCHSGLCILPQLEDSCPSVKDRVVRYDYDVSFRHECSTENFVDTVPDRHLLYLGSEMSVGAV